MRIITMLLGAMCLMAALVFAQIQDVPEAEKAAAQQVAREALKDFPLLVTEDNYDKMGFTSAGEVYSADLGVPLREFMIRLDELQKYNEETNPIQLLKDMKTFIYPVLVDREVRSSITIQKQDKDWQAVSFGGKNLINLVEGPRREIAASVDQSSETILLVRIPAMKLVFLGHRVDEDLQLTHILDDPRFEFQKGETQPATRILEVILPAAKQHTGLPS